MIVLFLSVLSLGQEYFLLLNDKNRLTKIGLSVKIELKRKGSDFKMIRYDENFLNLMQNDQTFTEMYGIPVQTKRIPDESRPGHLDPREFAIIKAQADHFARMAQENKLPVHKEPTVEDTRMSMGFPNLNMNTIELYTKYEEIDVNGNKVGIWVYTPRKPEGKTGRAGFIYIHGGGWMGGSVYAVENPCRLLAERADCVVFNIDYALAPEKPYPNGFNDCFGALEYIYQNAEKYGVDREKLGMGGDSAGGNLTAACALKDRNLGTNMLKYEALIYPAVLMGPATVPGYEWKLSDYVIAEEQYDMIEPCLGLGRPPKEGDPEAIDSVTAMYLQNGESLSEPYISPMAADSHAGLCKTLVAVAEFDGLRLQGEQYAKKLIEANVDVRAIRYLGVTHAFIDKLGILPQAEDLVQEIANDMKKL